MLVVEFTRIYDSYIPVIWIVKVRVNMYGPICLVKEQTILQPFFLCLELLLGVRGLWHIQNGGER
jgi:hypothetical protein